MSIERNSETGNIMKAHSKYDLEAASEKNSSPSEKRVKNDGRLFPDVELYCEGYPKPLLRGMLHLVSSILLPFGLLNLVRESKGSPIAVIASATYALSNILCYGTSALYHVGRWSIQVEISLQKLGILFSTIFYSPIQKYLFNQTLIMYYDFFVLSLSRSFFLNVRRSLWNCYIICWDIYSNMLSGFETDQKLPILTIAVWDVFMDMLEYYRSKETISSSPSICAGLYHIFFTRYF